MPRSNNRKRGEEPESPDPWPKEVVGLAWMAGGLVLLLSLVSYSPADLPSWRFLGFLEPFADKSGAGGENWIGPVGGLLGFLQILLFGAAACFLPVGMMWFGVLKFAFDGRVWPRAVMGVLLMLLAGSSWLHVAEIFFQDWTRYVQMPSPGGVIGQGLGGKLLMGFIGKVGTLLFTGMVYAVAVLYVTGVEPVGYVCSVARAAGVAWRRARLAAAADDEDEQRLLAQPTREQVAAERERLREARKRDRDLARAAEAEEEARRDPQGELPLREVPVPQIIDASQRRSLEPGMAGAKPFERRKAGHQFLAVGGFEDYELPGFDLLDPFEGDEAPEANRSELLETQRTIIDCLGEFGIEVTPGDITRGPTITRYEIYPTTGLRVSRIAQMEADLARATRAERINILAPIPGKDTVGIEIANSTKVAVPLHELLHDPEFRSAKKKIPLALGKDVYGNTVIGDLAAMPHLLVAGATGSGKSVCINSIIASILFKFGPDELRFIMVDPKVVEMQMYNKLPHLVVPVVTDPKKTVAALKWVVNEMEKRYRIFAREGVRNFDGFNNRPRPEKAAAEPVVKAGAQPEGRRAQEEFALEPGEPSAGEGVVPADAVAEDLPPWEERMGPSDPFAAMPEGDLGVVAARGLAGVEPSDPFVDEPVMGRAVPDLHQPPAWAMAEDGDEVDEEEMDSLVAALSEGDLGPEADEDDEAFLEEEQVPDRFPYIVVLIDELADLMQTAPADVETCIARIAQKARAAGIHLIIATQTPRADVVTGIIKANIPSRIAFQVSSQLDSRVILDTKGAEKLVGKGDMLYLPPGSAKLERAQGAYVTDTEVERIIAHCAGQGGPRFETDIHASLSGEDGEDEDEISEADEELILKCIEVARQERKCSTSLLQRRLRLGYTRAARMVDILEQRGIVGPGDGAKPREVFVK
jgi:DNA segregation ATPase FtsK/SpoIIIE, S-DNA-T family